MDLVKTDLEMAQYICQELRAGNRQAILPLFYEYNNIFKRFVNKRLSYSQEAEDILSNFWVNLLDGKAFCNYHGDRGASLKSYLWRILENEIRDHIRKRKSFTPISDIPEDSLLQCHGVTIASSSSDPENDLLHKEKNEFLIKIIHEAMLILSEISPRDAHLIWLKLIGKDYKEMALEELGSMAVDKKELGRKSNSIKKQFTRPHTGSIAKFMVILKRLMVKYKIYKDDLF